MKTTDTKPQNNFRIWSRFNRQWTEHHFETDDQAFDYAQSTTDETAPPVEKLINGRWHCWNSERCQWMVFTPVEYCQRVVATFEAFGHRNVDNFKMAIFNAKRIIKDADLQTQGFAGLIAADIVDGLPFFRTMANMKSGVWGLEYHEELERLAHDVEYVRE